MIAASTLPFTFKEANMKRFPILLMVVAAIALMASCVGNEVEDKYKDWRNDNTEWFNRQINRTDASGKSYYQLVTASWDPSARVLIHWFNDTMLTRNNLKPLFTSTVDVKYRGRLYDSTPFDSSYLSTSPADSIFRTALNGGIIEGWPLALTHMHVGDSCEVVIPYQQGYGTSSSGIIKPFSMLIFNLKLVSIYGYETH